MQKKNRKLYLEFRLNDCNKKNKQQTKNITKMACILLNILYI